MYNMCSEAHIYAAPSHRGLATTIKSGIGQDFLNHKSYRSPQILEDLYYHFLGWL